MKRLIAAARVARPWLVLPLLLAACGFGDVRDLRLEDVRAASAADIRRSVRYEPWLRLFESQPRPERGAGFRNPYMVPGLGPPLLPVLVEVSTATDLRRRDSLSDPLSFAERCEGRREIGGVDRRAPIRSGFLADAIGDLGLPPVMWPPAATRPAPAADGRFRYTLLLAQENVPALPAVDADGRRRSWSDLRSDEEDICIYVEASDFPFRPWRSNTVVVPHAAIRAALGAP